MPNGRSPLRRVATRSPLLGMSTENTNALRRSPSKLGGASAPQKEFVCCLRDGEKRKTRSCLSLCILASLAFCQIICCRCYCCLSKLLGGWQRFDLQPVECFWTAFCTLLGRGIGRFIAFCCFHSPSDTCENVSLWRTSHSWTMPSKKVRKYTWLSVIDVLVNWNWTLYGHYKNSIRKWHF